MMPSVFKKSSLIDKYLKKNTKVLFSVCTHRNMHIDGMVSAMKLYGQNKHDILWSPVKGDALIDRARSRIASHFILHTDAEVLFFVDDDEYFKPEDVIKTIDNVIGGMDICGALVMLKKPVNMVQNYIDKNILFFKDQTVTFSLKAKPIEINMLGSGFMAIHRKVFEKMIKESDNYPMYHPLNVPFCHPSDLKFWPFFQPYPKELEKGKFVYLSEDWAFCDRARNLGFKIWLDPSIFIDHIGEYRWNLADALVKPKINMDENFSISIS